MSGDKGQTGRCLCGAVKFTIKEPVREVGACHCDMCRRWSGGPFFALHCGPDSVRFEEETALSRYKSSEWAERAFCATCGSNIYYHLLQSDEIFLLAGTLDDQSGLKFTSQVFIDEKPAFYNFANQTENMTGAELFALYAPPDSEGHQG